MNIIDIEHIDKVYGGKTVFSDASFGIHAQDKIGIIGINGTGKTTLLRLIAGLSEPDAGRVIRQNNLTLTYLPQNPRMPEDATVLSYVVEGRKQKGWNTESEAKTVLNRLGIADHDALLGTLSGGQQKRVALARTLVNPADVLILDEPTNHLDNEMAQWLEDFLIRYTGTLIMVTHDRYFLDRVSGRILEIDQGKLYAYPGNYTEFLDRKAQREEIELATARKQKSILKIETAWASRGCRARSTKQQARLDRLEALKNAAGPMAETKVELESVDTRMGKKTIELSGICKHYGDLELLTDFSYIFPKNSRIGIIGRNGCGKSTLIKMIAGQIEPDAGRIEIGETIRIGYFSQSQDEFDDTQKVIESIKEIAEYIPTKDGSVSASQMLERFLFDDAMQYAPIGKLSGGEKKRLSLLRVLAAAPNVLLLDEITNDLDIPTLIILEDFLTSFSGIVIAVSHDRYFLDNIATRILAFEEEGIKEYMGDYTDYLAARKQKESEPAREAGAGKKQDPKKDWKISAPKRLKFSYKEQREYEGIDDEIETIEGHIRQLEADMEANASAYDKLSELTGQKEAAERQLEEKMDRWVYLNDLAEQIAAQG